MFLGTFHGLLRALSMDLPKKKLRNATGRNTLWGVFKVLVSSGVKLGKIGFTVFLSTGQVKRKVLVNFQPQKESYEEPYSNCMCVITYPGSLILITSKN